MLTAKKIVSLACGMILLLCCTACGQKDVENTSSSVAQNSTVLAEDETTANTETDLADDANIETENSNEDGVDVDLSVLSSTMVYAEMYNMVTMPLVYHGKVVKLTGIYDEFYDVMTDTRYSSVFVVDALACCAQGIEITFDEDYVYPDDYPTDGNEITMIGTYEVYYPDPESDTFYIRLADTIVLDEVAYTQPVEIPQS